ncbi:hypothetical protein ACFSTD_08295 [Novosphingobium colocasiae]|uniref:Uncharacterized protein n=1 Tax=Novosphingobium colocasiae TaxID=1256513 RepID=A0A918PGZ5_9SPHN|nr:hypothetical protein [Novosphingobium colocasiae]GGZ08190.1 hypothetical protein GCM10011614_23740 [Novosphingobium colocasiae]
MRKVWLIAAAAGTLLVMPAQARQDKPADAKQEKAERPLTDGNPNLVDAAKTPLSDLNIDKKDIPPTLTNAIAEPYTLDGLKGCKKLSSAITELDGILGPDIEMPQEDREKLSSGRIAKWVVAKFIPFRGLIREISGANDQEVQLRTAVQAGMARRAFLKGVGEARGCKYPARPAPASMIAARKAEIVAAREQKNADKAEGKTVAKAD